MKKANMWKKTLMAIGIGRPELHRGSLQQEIFNLQEVFHHGVPNKASCLAYDVVQKVVAIGTLDGRIKILGKPGVELSISVKHRGHPITALCFAPNTGLLVAFFESSLEVWNLETPKVVGSMTFDEIITTFHLYPESMYLFVGTDQGNVFVVDIQKVELSTYRILSNRVRQDTSAKHRAPVRWLGVEPDSGSAILIAYGDGLIALWNFKQQKITKYFELNTQSLGACAWHPDGKMFIAGDEDGSLSFWKIKSKKPFEQINVSKSKAKCEPIKRMVWSKCGGGDMIIVQGGTTTQEPGLTVLQGTGQANPYRAFHIPSNMGKVKHFVVNYSLPWDEAEPRSILMLTESNHFQSNILSRSLGFPIITLPPSLVFQDSRIVAVQLYPNVSKLLFHSLFEAGNIRFDPTYWLAMGGKFADRLVTGRDLLVTCHESGKIRFWDASSIVLRLLLSFYAGDQTSAPNNERRKGSSNEDQFITVFQFCPVSRILVLGCRGGRILLYKFTTMAADHECLLYRPPQPCIQPVSTAAGPPPSTESPNSPAQTGSARQSSPPPKERSGDRVSPTARQPSPPPKEAEGGESGKVKPSPQMPPPQQSTPPPNEGEEGGESKKVNAPHQAAPTQQPSPPQVPTQPPAPLPPAEAQPKAPPIPEVPLPVADKPKKGSSGHVASSLSCAAIPKGPLLSSQVTSSASLIEPAKASMGKGIPRFYLGLEGLLDSTARVVAFLPKHNLLAIGEERGYLTIIDTCTASRVLGVGVSSHPEPITTLTWAEVVDNEPNTAGTTRKVKDLLLFVGIQSGFLSVVVFRDKRIFFNRSPFEKKQPSAINLIAVVNARGKPYIIRSPKWKDPCTEKLKKAKGEALLESVKKEQALKEEDWVVMDEDDSESQDCHDSEMQSEQVELQADKGWKGNQSVLNQPEDTDEDHCDSNKDEEEDANQMGAQFLLLSAEASLCIYTVPGYAQVARVETGIPLILSHIASVNGEYCLVCFTSTVALRVYSLMDLTLIYQISLEPFSLNTDTTALCKTCMLDDGRMVLSSRSSELYRFSLFMGENSLDVPRSLPVVHIPGIPQPERSKGLLKSFFGSFDLSIFGEVDQLARRKETDPVGRDRTREQARGREDDLAQARQKLFEGHESKPREKHEREGAGNEKVRETHKGISGLKGQMNRNAELLNERGEKMNQLALKTAEMEDTSNEFYQNAKKLADKYKNRKWYEF